MAKPTSEILPLPDFSVPMVRKFDDNFITDDISLADWSKNSRKGLVLYFYPKDNTPGCSTQATDFTDMQHQFDKLGYDVIGVSCDGIDSHKNFIDKTYKSPLSAMKMKNCASTLMLSVKKTPTVKKQSVWYVQPLSMMPMAI